MIGQGCAASGAARGCAARTKFLIQLAIALGAVLAFRVLLDAPDMFLPGMKDEINLGSGIFPLLRFVIVTIPMQSTSPMVWMDWPG